MIIHSPQLWVEANSNVTEQIRTGRNFAKQIEGFCAMQKVRHGEDWEIVFDSDTDGYFW